MSNELALSCDMSLLKNTPTPSFSSEAQIVRVMGISAPPITPQVLFGESAIGQAKKIVSDPSHILHREYRLLPSGMRYETHTWHYNRYKYSFIPLSITLLNVSLAEGRQRGRRARRM